MSIAYCFLLIYEKAVKMTFFLRGSIWNFRKLKFHKKTMEHWRLYAIINGNGLKSGETIPSQTKEKENSYEKSIHFFSKRT